MPGDFKNRVRVRLYELFLELGRCPSKAEVAATFGCGVADVADAFDELAAAHILVLQPGSGEVLMANPLSAVPTPFVVETKGVSDSRSWYGNCIWDAPGGDCHAAKRRARACVLRMLRRKHDHPSSQRRGDIPAARGRSFRASCAALVGRHCLQLKNHASLPVGRSHRSVVRSLETSARRYLERGAGLEAGRRMVSRSIFSRLAATHGGRGSRTVPLAGNDL